MTLPPAALPGHAYPAAPTEFLPHPGTDQPLGCPHCGHGDALVASYPVVTTVAVDVSAVEATSRTEVVPAGNPSAPAPGNYQQPTKVACAVCRWSYEGPDPIGKLQPVTA